MEISYKSRKLQKTCCERKKMRAAFGPQMADRLEQRLAEFEAADTLEDMRRLPGARCHELTGDRKGELAVDLLHPKRLVFIPDHDPVPEKGDGGLDWSRVRRILIIEIVDYH